MSRSILSLLVLVILVIPVLVAGRRHRRRIVALRAGSKPAGLRHLAAQVGALSSFGIGLPLPPQGAGRRRVGTLVGVR